MVGEEDKNTKDSQIRTLRDEIAHQEDMIVKLGKEKKGAGEGRQKTEEDIQAMEDRCNHLCKVKAKLEQSLDECEDSLEREKKGKVITFTSIRIKNYFSYCRVTLRR